ncbi:MAG: GNAT family N-acetyltransferase [Thiotrichales bacterium]|nr:GNAT family N-acetyltransferase [Thiotrichales bacterium]
MNLTNEANQAAKTFVHTLEELNICGGIRNVDTQYQLIQIGEQLVPATLNYAEYHNSYVCSPYTAYISYAKDELSLLKRPLLENLLSGLMMVAGVFLKLGKLNQTLSINNWLVSTNLLPSWNPTDIAQATQRLSEQYPKHSLSIRSLNGKQHAQLIDTLKSQGWLMIPARQIYWFDAENRQWWRRNNTKNDQALLRKVEAGKLPLQWVKPDELLDSDFKSLEICFNQLFIEKHSHYNPQFSEEFLRQMHHKKLIEFHSFRDDSGRIVATIGLFTQQNTITTPIVGYDTDLPKTLGLYRLLMAVLLRLTYERQQPMNLSSGAGSFKRARGGEAVLEVTAFYTQHLSPLRRWIHIGFAKLLNRFAPQMFEKHQI